MQKYFPNEASIKSKSSSPIEIEANKVEENDEVPDVKKKEKPNIEINNNMATFTFVDILISQRHYSDALGVLKILEKNGRNQDRINQKRDEIKQKLRK